MEKSGLHKFLTYTPLILVIALSGVYSYFLGVYAECRLTFTVCHRVDVNTIYLPDFNPLNRYPDDRQQSMKDIENQLEQKAQRRAEVFRQKVEKTKLQSDMQAQVLAEAVVTRSGQATDLNDAGKRAEIVRDKAKDSVDALTAEQEALDKDISALNTRLAELHDTQIQRYTKRLTWLLFTGMFVVACLGALVIAFVVVHQSLGESELKEHRTTLLLLFGGILVIYGFIRFAIDSKYTNTFEHLVGLLKNGATSSILPLVNFFDLIGAVAVLALLIAATMALWHPAGFYVSEPTKFQAKLGQLALRRKFLRLILYSGTIVLVIGILRVQVLLDWVLTYSLTPTLLKSVDDFNKVLISSLGVFYTLLLVAVFVPGRFIIIDRAERLAGADAQALKDEGFGSASTLSFMELLPRIAALLAPFLIGPVAELVKSAFQ